ncbi:hypothetical protein N3K66_002177 [Trichothecium roseum]|uniref:Uncharacterized protein n=1 Tax=Trichothecium roseum TaxID=47278 RepID=A0ACC0VAT6_9HYPO|nr:hypothetical protein N3K66_002177 [Trichothecium roseum]
MRLLLSAVTLLFAAFASAISTTGNRLLVVLDDVADKEGYGKFLADLKSRNFQIEYETPRSEALSLFDLGERKYDHLIFLPTKVKGLGPSLTPNALVDFVNADGNILVALSSTQATSTSLTSFLAELDIVLPDERTGTVIDHFNYDTVSAGEKHDVLVLDTHKAIRDDVTPLFSISDDAVVALPRAAGHVLGPGPLLTPILRAPDTAYSYDPKEQGSTIDPEELFAAGRQLSLLTGFQARNSARVAVLGSAEMLTDAWFDSKVQRVGTKGKVATQNREFAKRLSGWTFQEVGVLRVNGIEHKLKGENETNPGIYRVKNEVDYTISLSEHNWDTWTPFTPPQNDIVQLEFSMLSPFHRLNLAPQTTTESATVYGTSFILPDQHGIFNFRVNYKRPLLTYIDEKRTVSVRHLAHDEFVRSYAITGAWPWVTGIGAVVSGWLFFVLVWLFSRPIDENKKRR